MPEELNRLWEDDAHWRAGIYRCAADPRVVVRGTGTRLYTVNFGHPRRAWAWILGGLLFMTAATIVPIVLHAPDWALLPSVGAALVVLFGAHWWVANRE